MKGAKVVSVALLSCGYVFQQAVAQEIATPTTPVSTTPVSAPTAAPATAPAEGPTAEGPSTASAPAPTSVTIPVAMPPVATPIVSPPIVPPPIVPPPVTPVVPPIAPAPAPPPLPGPTEVEGTPWTFENPMPYALYDVGCAIHEEKIYIFGNSDEEDGQQATVIYDPAAQGFEEGPNRPRPGGGHFVTSAGQSLWVFGGYTDAGNSQVGSSVQRIGPDPNNPQNPPPYFWDSNIEQGPKNVGAAVAGKIKDKVHICGGWDDIAKGTAIECSIFNIAKAQTSPWSAGPELQIGVHKACYGSDGSTLYIAGGRTKSLGKFDVTSVTPSVQLYTPGKSTVLGPSDIPEPRSAYISAFTDGQLICMGGEINANFTDPSVAESKGVDPVTRAYTRVDVYDTAAETWSLGTDLPEGLHSGCAAVMGDTVYVIGGRTKFGGDKDTGSNKIYSIPVSELLAGTEFSDAPAPTPTPSPVVDLTAPTVAPGPSAEPALVPSVAEPPTATPTPTLTPEEAPVESPETEEPAQAPELAPPTTAPAAEPEPEEEEAVDEPATEPEPVEEEEAGDEPAAEPEPVEEEEAGDEPAAEPEPVEDGAEPPVDEPEPSAQQPEEEPEDTASRSAAVPGDALTDDEVLEPVEVEADDEDDAAAPVEDDGGSAFVSSASMLATLVSVGVAVVLA